MDRVKNTSLISYILPAYQAESFIYDNLRIFAGYCAGSGFRSEVIVVNDGSTDGTDAAIRKFIDEESDGVSLKYLDLKKNVGKGLAVKQGVEAADGDIIVFFDSDLPYSFENLSNIVQDLSDEKANVVIASRMHPDSIYRIKSSNLSYIYIRHTSGRVYNWLINLFTGLSIEDTQAGLKGFDRETAEQVFNRMTISGFSFDVDLLTCAKENGRKISTVPVELNYDSEMSTISFIKQTFIMSSGLFKVLLKRLTGYYRK